ncbi:hypothetical protein DFQ11_10810 [Winogradskyella epiphytica]|uniref:Uncharacterized protein n=1 Tax=Winogradskyella epiphytica TaxID=262005 RepID=A0A2V4WTI9_9FLAO|nr:hypothetical protein [Winogradskyella epiphytica]PYE79986.1 hypothetical protein DFQ11_10810 [Winogradskyella epiphytica]
MSYLLNIKSKLKDSSALAIQLLLLILGSYCFIMVEENRKWKALILLIGGISYFLSRNRKNHPIIWITLFALLLEDLIHDYFWLANHHFLLTFMVLSVIAFHYHKRGDYLFKNIQILLVIVVITSVFQKLMSRQFISGDFYYFMINQGALFRKFINFFPESVEIIKSNSANLTNFQATNPNEHQSLIIRDIFPKVNFYSQIFVWLTIIIESAVAIAILFKPKSVWSHLILAMMIIGILATRFETGFMALLAICGVFLCNNIYLKVVYTLISVSCFVLIVTRIGYH